MENDKSAAECTRESVKKGTKYALVVGKKVCTLDGREAELDKLAGEGAVQSDGLVLSLYAPSPLCCMDVPAIQLA
jgi:hypothetical protein